MAGQTMADYVVDHDITVAVTSDRGTQVRDGWEHHAFELRLTNGATGREMETPWRQGMGIKTYPSDTAAEVLDSLVSDASGTDQSFPDWAEEYGYEMRNVREAWETYQACVEVRDRLEQFLGSPGELEHVATDIERL